VPPVLDVTTGIAIVDAKSGMPTICTDRSHRPKPGPTTIGTDKKKS
jgi:hypothetical protein